jgi:hypothetical protein
MAIHLHCNISGSKYLRILCDPEARGTQKYYRFKYCHVEVIFCASHGHFTGLEPKYCR